jgi:hypothetical protein
MSIDKGKEQNITNDTDACYEELASQEEIYLEETEEEVHAVLESYDSPSSSEEVERTMCRSNLESRQTQSFDEQLAAAAQELIAGDSDDPPLSEEAIVEMVRMTHLPKASNE